MHVAMTVVDKVQPMDENLHSIFMANYGKVICYCCQQPLAVGDDFKLSSISSLNLHEASLLAGKNIFADVEEDHMTLMMCGKVTCNPFAMVLNRIDELAAFKAEGKDPDGNII